MNKIQHLLQDLISFESISPNDANCQAYLSEKLLALGFKVEHYNKEPVANLYAQYGQGSPTIIFAGHTDVVPAGDSALWQTPAFTLTEKNAQWIGRGVADMKGALVAMLIMAQRLIVETQRLKGSFGFLITSGEEGDFYHNGTPYVMEQLHQKNIKPKYCIVGEPSSHQKVGDTLKVGRRGSLNAEITIDGRQGHVAYPHLADNPIHKANLALESLIKFKFDAGNDYFPPSALQITNIHAGVGSNNVIPDKLVFKLNIRFSTEQTMQKIKNAVMHCFMQHNIHPKITWSLSGEPFLTKNGKLLTTCQQIIKTQLGKDPVLATDGGTSDGRFIAQYGIEVIELGLCNKNIHQANESIGIEEISQLANLYTQIGFMVLE